MTLHLPKVTACLIDATCPELASMSLRDTLEQVSFAEVMIVSPDNFAPEHRWIECPRWKDRLGPSNFLWYELASLLTTDFMLILAWDSWVLDASCWTDDFLNYDAVGAPWWYDDGWNVNAWLRSKRLLQFLHDNSRRFPMHHPEDHYIGRVYRKELEKFGLRWPSEQLASKFAFETTRPSKTSKHFMFHSPFNFPAVLKGERLKERVDAMKRSDYLKDDWRLLEMHTFNVEQIWPHLA